MAPRPIHLSPLAQMIGLAIIAREKGLSFDEFWSEAMHEGGRLIMQNDPAPPPGAVRWPTHKTNRLEWWTAIDGTRDSWKRCYEGAERTEREAAMSAMSDGFRALDEVAARRAQEELHGGLGSQQALLSPA